MSIRIALLEDDTSQSDLVRLWLTAAGHKCHVFSRGQDFMRALQRETFDLLMIDWMIPDITGIEVLNWMTANLATPTPVLFVTARDSEEDIVMALNAGADDYLVKPLRKLELLARIAALARRGRPGAKQDSLTIGEFSIDPARHTITRHGDAVELTQKDFDLAVFLFRNRGKLLSRGHILESVWGRSANVNTRTVDTHVSRLRGKLGLTPENGWKLSAVYQHGYRLEHLREIDPAPDPGGGPAAI